MTRPLRVTEYHNELELTGPGIEWLRGLIEELDAMPRPRGQGASSRRSRLRTKRRQLVRQLREQLEVAFVDDIRRDAFDAAADRVAEMWELIGRAP